MSSSKFDIVVYGATGFTGQLVAEYLAAHYKGDASLKWAMAGRSKDKLATVRDAIGAPADTPLIVADASDPASLQAIVGMKQLAKNGLRYPIAPYGIQADVRAGMGVSYAKK
jgi:short subunit dehydrogenase-like uncharacterized protein